MECFVHKCKDIYGSTFTVYNVHNLLHLHEYVSFFNCSLNDVSAFQFENYLQVIKKLVRSSQNHLVHVAKRLTEIEKSSGQSGHHTNGGQTFVSTSRKDMCFLMNTEEYAFVKEIKEVGELVCNCIMQQHTESFFTNPCDSKLFNIAYISNNLLAKRGVRKVLKKQDLNRKVACLPYDDGCVL